MRGRVCMLNVRLDTAKETGDEEVQPNKHQGSQRGMELSVQG